MLTKKRKKKLSKVALRGCISLLKKLLLFNKCMIRPHLRSTLWGQLKSPTVLRKNDKERNKQLPKGGHWQYSFSLKHHTVS